jgi:hypothetical protein
VQVFTSAAVSSPPLYATSITSQASPIPVQNCDSYDTDSPKQDHLNVMLQRTQNTVVTILTDPQFSEVMD